MNMNALRRWVVVCFEHSGSGALLGSAIGGVMGGVTFAAEHNNMKDKITAIPQGVVVGATAGLVAGATMLFVAPLACSALVLDAILN